MKKKVIISAIGVVLVLTMALALFVACNEDDQKTQSPESYTITFVDGETVVSTSSIENGSAVTADQIPNGPDHSGKIFDGWYVGETKVEAGYKPQSDVTAQAKYHDDTPTMYTVSFSLGEYTEGTAPASVQVQAGGTVELPIVEWPEHSLLGWKANNEGETIAAQTTVTVNANVTYYAIWSEGPGETIYTITFQDPDGNQLGDPINVGAVWRTPEGIYLAEHPLELGQYYGWYLWSDTDGIGEQIDPHAYNGKANIIVRLIVKDYKEAELPASYQGIWQGESNDVGTCKLEINGMDITLTMNDEEPVEVLGVYENPAGGYYLAVPSGIADPEYNYYPVDIKGDKLIFHFMPSADEDYAIELSKENVYIVEYFCGVASDTGYASDVTGNTPAAQQIQPGESVTLVANPWKRTGYQFTGYDIQAWTEIEVPDPITGPRTYYNWKAIENETGKEAGYSYTPHCNIRITATWAPAIVTVSYDSNGGSGSITATQLDYKKNLALPTESFTAPAGCTFEGWAYSSDGEIITTHELENKPYIYWTDLESHLTLLDNGNYTLTLYAIWSEPSAIQWESLVGAYTHNSDTIYITTDGAGEYSSSLEAYAVGSLIVDNEYVLVYKNALPKNSFQAEALSASKITITPSADGTIDVDGVIYSNKTGINNVAMSTFEGTWEESTKTITIDADSVTVSLNGEEIDADYVIIDKYIVINFTASSKTVYQYILEKSDADLVGYCTTSYDRNTKAATFTPKSITPPVGQDMVTFDVGDPITISVLFGTSISITSIKVDKDQDPITTVYYTTSADGSEQTATPNSTYYDATYGYYIAFGSGSSAPKAYIKFDFEAGTATFYNTSDKDELGVLKTADAAGDDEPTDDDLITVTGNVAVTNTNFGLTYHVIAITFDKNDTSVVYFKIQEATASDEKGFECTLDTESGALAGHAAFIKFDIGDGTSATKIPKAYLDFSEDFQTVTLYSQYGNADEVLGTLTASAAPTEAEFITFSNESGLLVTGTQMGNMTFYSVKIDVNGIDKKVTVHYKGSADKTEDIEWTERDDAGDFRIEKLNFSCFWFHVADDNSSLTIYYSNASNKALKQDKGSLPAEGSSVGGGDDGGDTSDWKSIEWYQNVHNTSFFHDILFYYESSYSEWETYTGRFTDEYASNPYYEMKFSFYELVFTKDLSYIMLITQAGQETIIACNTEKSQGNYKCFEVAQDTYVWLIYESESEQLIIYADCDATTVWSEKVDSSNGNGIYDRWNGKFTK